MELNNKIKEYSVCTDNIDKDKLPAFLIDCIDEYLSILNPKVPKSALLMMLMVHISHFICFNRVKIVCNSTNTFPNIYGLTFMPSGSGKDKPHKDIENMIRKITDSMFQMAEDYYTEQEDKIIEEAESLPERSQAKFVRENRPRKMAIIFGSGTREGVESYREVMASAGFGCLHLGISEFIDYIVEKNTERDSLITLVKEAFDNGDTKGKLIKGEKMSQPVNGVPITMMSHSSVSGIVGDKACIKKLHDFFERGYARRGCVVYPQFKSFIEKENIRYSYEDEQGALNNMAKFSAQLESIFKKIKYEGYVNEMSVSREAYELYKDNIEFCGKGANHYTEDGLRSEISSRAWKALKIAGVFALLNHPDVLIIEEEDYLQAVYFVSYYGVHFQRFYSTGLNGELDVEELYKHIVDNPHTTKSKFRKLGFVKKKENQHDSLYVTRWLDNLIIQVEELAKDNNMIFECTKGKTRGTSYVIKEYPKHKEPEEEIIVKYSQGLSNKKTETTLEPRECDFFKFDEVIKAGKIYSAGKFKDSKRLQANFMGEENMIMFDIDNDGTTEEDQLTVSQAKDKLRDRFICLIATTKSHNKDKSGKGIRERFRIVIPVTHDLPLDKDHRERVLQAIAKELTIFKYCGKGEMTDTARYFFSHDGDFAYNKNGEILNWEVYDKPEPPNETFVPQDYSNNKYNGDFQVKDAKGNMRSFSEFEYLSVADKAVPVFCPNHKDKEPSAFIKRSSKSNNLFIKCSADQCGFLKFIK